MTSTTFAKTVAPEWLLAMWKEIDDKIFGAGFDCFAENACATSASPTGTVAKRSARTYELCKSLQGLPWRDIAM